MESTKNMRDRYRKAFARYSNESSRYRAGKAPVPSRGPTPAVSGSQAELQSAEDDYRVVRQEYIDRLLEE